VFVACRQGQTATAQRWAGTMTKLTTALFRETSPVSLKYALSLLGLMSAQVRLPLVELTDATKAEVKAAVAYLNENFSDYASPGGGRSRSSLCSVLLKFPYFLFRTATTRAGHRDFQSPHAVSAPYPNVRALFATGQQGEWQR
jgi:hypothetical protein